MGSYSITPSAATGGTFTASNYAIIYGTGNLGVTPVPLTVTASPESKSYGQSVSFGSGSTLFTSSGLENGETIGSVTLNVSSGGGGPAAAVGSYTITPSAAAGGTFTASNYAIAYDTGSLGVTTAPLTITPTIESKTYGQSLGFGPGSKLFSSSGLENGETIGSVTLQASNGGGVPTSVVGSYTITPSAATGGTFRASNYAINYNTGNLDVTAAPLTVTASPESKTYGQSMSLGSGSTLFSSTGLQNGETIGSVTLVVSNSGGAQRRLPAAMKSHRATQRAARSPRAITRSLTILAPAPSTETAAFDHCEFRQQNLWSKLRRKWKLTVHQHRPREWRNDWIGDIGCQ